MYQVSTATHSGTPTMCAYWTPAYHPSEPRSEAEWIERFRDEWLDTIGKQMVADVDVGAEFRSRCEFGLA